MKGAAPPAELSLQERFPHRANAWQLRTTRLALRRRPLVMGILNVTPDSFSDGGRFLDKSAAAEHALRMEAEGADLIDVGGESTRPYSESVDPATELARVMPVLEALAGRLKIPLSIDTQKAAVAREAIAAGVEIVNDVSALSADPEMLAVARESRAGLCVMHMRGTPQTMQDNPAYDDVVEHVVSFLRTRRDELVAAGIDAKRIALDPGIGFGKTHAHNLELVAHCWRMHELAAPVLVGHSRKAFIGKLLGNQSAERTAGSIGVALALARQGVQIIRVHDVAEVREALLLFEACGGIEGQPAARDTL